MDQVRAILRVLWQQRFWVLSVVGVLVVAVCWMMATNHIQAEFTTNKNTITGKFNDMRTISSAQYRGNESVNAKNEQETEKIRKQVLALWKQLYDKQRETVLKWPKVLGEEFLSTVENLKFQDDIKSPTMRGLYWNYIKNRFNDLVDIVQAKKMKEGEMTAGFTGGDMSAAFETQDIGPRTMPGMEGQIGMPPEEDFLVQWIDQGNLRAKLDFPRLPSSLQIWVTQEDLWVYETLLHAIANTNTEKNATRIDNAAIRGIIQLDVGQAAAFASKEPGNIIMPEGAMAGGDPSMMGEGGMGGMGAMGEGGMGGMMGEGGMGMDGQSSGDSYLLANRYVDQEGNPIADASSGFGAEYRRLPIRMRLYMDQRWIPKVLIECANAPLPIEVQRVRINPEQSGAGFDATIAGSGGGAAGAPMGGMGEMMGGRGMMPGMGMGGYRGGMEGGMGMAMPAATGGASDMAQVEILGLVYIYNQPDAAALTGSGEGESAPVDETVAAVQ